MTDLQPDRYTRLHRFSIVVSIVTVLLIMVGGHVNSTGSGLSVPDWPLTYNENPITYPVHKWQGGILWEHGHRLLATLDGLLVLIEMIWIVRIERNSKRRWLKNLSIVAFVAVCLQGLLGGLTVLFGLPTAISASHAVLAHSLMISTVAIALGTSRRWLEARRQQVGISPGLQRLLLATVIMTFIQILMGALVRHTYSGLAIQDFPLAFGQVFPELPTFGIAIHYFHRVGALVLSILIFTQGIRILRAGSTLSVLRTPALLLMVLVVVQIALGAFVIWTREHVVINTLHVGVGTTVFAMAFMTWFLSTRHYRFAQPNKPVYVASPTGHQPG